MFQSTREKARHRSRAPMDCPLGVDQVGDGGVEGYLLQSWIRCMSWCRLAALSIRSRPFVSLQTRNGKCNIQQTAQLCYGSYGTPNQLYVQEIPNEPFDDSPVTRVKANMPEPTAASSCCVPLPLGGTKQESMGRQDDPFFNTPTDNRIGVCF